MGAQRGEEEEGGWRKSRGSSRGRREAGQWAGPRGVVQLAVGREGMTGGPDFQI
jgi:hypothetical protein